MQRGCRAARPEVPTELGLLGGKERPQRPKEEWPKAGRGCAAKKHKAKAKRLRLKSQARAGSAGRSRFLELDQGSSCTAMAWFVPPGEVQSFGPTAPRSPVGSLGLGRSVPAARGRGSLSLPRPQQQVPEAREPEASRTGCGLLDLCSSLRHLVVGWWTRHFQRRRSRHVHFANPLVTVRYID
ncbi:hypothetical protein TURU_063763 [Turdus rufiventris]|nr:hypothetical protein TURU_063763 [Turdus rufiventris]